MKSVPSITYKDKTFQVGDRLYSTVYGDYEIMEYDIVSILSDVSKPNWLFTIYATPTGDPDHPLVQDFDEYEIDELFLRRRDAVEHLMYQIINEQKELKILRERYTKELS